MPAIVGTIIQASSRKEDMPRPKLHSDEFILDTALGILLQKGPSAFTLSDVAEAVGISRAALIQRFKDKATLHLKVMERNTQEVRDYFAGASPEKGLDPLWAMLKDLIAGMGDGAGTGRLPSSIVGRRSGAVASRPCGGAEQTGPESYRGTTARRAAPTRAYRRLDSDGHSGVLHAMAR